MTSETSQDVLSNLVNTSVLPSYFNYFTIRVHKEVEVIDAATMHAIESCTPTNSKERSQALYRHTNPYSIYALCHGECFIQRLGYFVKVTEILWIHDDVCEGLPHSEALHEHDILRQGLNAELDSDHSTGKTVGVKKEYLRMQRRGMMALDPINTPALLQTLDTYLQEYDSSNVDFLTMEEYLPYRLLNVAYRVCTHFTRWAMDIHLSDEEMEAVHPFAQALAGILALTNDYHSWRMEKYQPTDRIRNAVPVLMRQHSLKEEQAKLLLKGIIVEEEEKVKGLRLQLEANSQLSSEMKRYIDALELLVGGHCYWSVTCPRYNNPQKVQFEAISVVAFSN